MDNSIEAKFEADSNFVTTCRLEETSGVAADYADENGPE